MSYYNFTYFYLNFDGRSLSMQNLYFYQNVTFGNLFDSILNFYPHLKICTCFDYKISHDGNYKYINEKDTLHNFRNQYGSTYLFIQITLNGKQCNCNKQFKEYYSKTKKEIIDDIEPKIIEEKVSFFKKLIEEKENIITNKTNENNNYSKEISDYQITINKLNQTIADLENKKRIIQDEKQNKISEIESLKKKIKI
jgi:hypothetical protein